MSTPHPALDRLAADIAAARHAFGTLHLLGPAEQAQVLAIAGESVPNAAAGASGAGVGPEAKAMLQQELAAASAAGAHAAWLDILGASVAAAAPRRRGRAPVVVAAIVAALVVAAGGVTFALTRPDAPEERPVATGAPGGAATPAPTPTVAEPSDAPTTTDAPPPPTASPTIVEPQVTWVDVGSATHDGLTYTPGDRDWLAAYTTHGNGFALVNADSETGEFAFVDYEHAKENGVQEVTLVVGPPTLPEDAPDGTTFELLGWDVTQAPAPPRLVRTYDVRIPAQDLDIARTETYLEVYDLRAETVVFARSLDATMPQDAGDFYISASGGAVVGQPRSSLDGVSVRSWSLEDGSLLWESDEKILAVLPDVVVTGECTVEILHPRTGKPERVYEPRLDLPEGEECWIQEASVTDDHVLVTYHASYDRLLVFDRRTGKIVLNRTLARSAEYATKWMDQRQPFLVLHEQYGAFEVIDLRDGSVPLFVSAEDVESLELRFDNVYDGKIWLRHTDQSFVRDVATGERVANDHDGPQPLLTLDTGWVLVAEHEIGNRIYRSDQVPGP